MQMTPEQALDKIQSWGIFAHALGEPYKKDHSFPDEAAACICLDYLLMKDRHKLDLAWAERQWE